MLPLLFALLVFLLPASALAQGADKPNEDDPKVAGQPARPGEATDRLIVKFEEDASGASKADARRKEGLAKDEDLGLIGAEVAKVEGQPVEDAVEDLNRRPDVEYAVPDRIVRPLGYGDEPRFAEQWGLENTGQAVNGGPAGTPDVDVDGVKAHAVTGGDPALVVAVIDDGVDFSHLDLKERAWTNPGESGSGKEINGRDDDGNGLIDDVNGYDFRNGNGSVYDAKEGTHGTHAASVVSASVNGQGMSGVAPGVQIMALKFMGGGAGYMSDAVSAIAYAKKNGASVINASWGYEGPPDPALKDAIDSSGVLVVAAAGNGGFDGTGDDNDANPNEATYPASYDSPNVLSVAAVDNKGGLAPFSNYGARSVDIAAPGVDVLGAAPAVEELGGATLSAAYGYYGKILVAGFGVEEISGAAQQASFVREALQAVSRSSGEPVVLVDDDQSRSGMPNAGATVAEAVRSATGTIPEVIEVGNGDGPGIDKLRGKVVVWATGQAYDSGPGSSTLTAADQNTIRDLLYSNGKVVLAGADALYRQEESWFAKDLLYLKVRGDVGSRTFKGAPSTAFAGKSYDLSGPLAQPEYHDAVSPADGYAPYYGVPSKQGVYPGAAASWTFESGTSSAAPFATGAAALAASGKPSLRNDPAALKIALSDLAKPAPATAGRTVTGKMVDAGAAAVDKEAPTVVITAPAEGGVDVAEGANVEATFSEGLNTSTINGGNFFLVKKGETAAVPAEFRYDVKSRKATLDPASNLPYLATYEVRIKGGTAGPKDLAGNQIVSDKTWSFSVEPDTYPPDTRINSGPEGQANKPSVEFAFSSTDTGSTFECSMDGAPFEPCSSLKGYKDLSGGYHQFRVASTDSVGNLDPTPAERWFSVDVVAPTVTYRYPDANAKNVPQSTYYTLVYFSETMASGSVNASTFSLTKKGDPNPVAAPAYHYGYYAYLLPDKPLDPGTTYTVRIKGGPDGAKDLVGIPLASDDVWSFTVAGAPNTSVDSGPSGKTAERSAAFEFSSSRDGDGFRCSLDAGPFEDCASPKRYETLEDGTHTFRVAATNGAGSEDASPAERTWTVDAKAPETTIDGGPSGATNDTSARFTFSSSEPNSAFECSLDGGAFEKCISPAEFANLSEGGHALEVRAVDEVGNKDATPAKRTWTIDRQAPAVVAVSPQAEATDVALAESVEATFDEAMGGDTVNGSSFTLFEEGSGTQVASKVTYDPATKKASLDPDADLKPGTRYTATVKGGDAGVKDAAGNPLAADKVWSFRPIAAPETRVDSGPSGRTRATSASFSFSSDQADVRFECSLDGAPFEGCASPNGYAALNDGDHEFRVRAVGRTGVIDESPERRAWAVDTKAPVVVEKMPGGGSVRVDLEANVKASFSEEMDPGTLNGATFKLLEEGGLEPVAAAVRYDAETRRAVLDPEALLDPETAYTATVEGVTDGAKDAVGNVLATDESWAFTTRPADTAPPETRIDSGPEGPTNDPSPSFSFSSDEPGSAFRCSIDDGPFADCSSPKSFPNLAEGTHVFRVTATDAAGNEDASPAQRSFRVDLTAPSVSGREPSGDATRVARNANVVVTFSEEVDPSTVTQDSFSLAKKGQTAPIAASVTPDASGKSATLDPTSDLDSDTTYTVTVRGGNAGVRDKAGNVTAADDTWSFITADTVAPAPPVMKLATASDTGISNNDGLTNDNTPTLEGTAEANSTVRVYEGTTLLGTATAGPGGAWSVTTAALADGTRYLRSTATDASGNTSGQTQENTSSSSELLEVRIDTARPSVSSVSPAQGTNTVAVGANAYASFSEEMDPASVNANSFVLVRSGTTTPLVATVSYATTARQATLDPGANLVAGTGYVATVRAVARDMAGNAMSADKVWSFSVNSVPTVTSITPGNGATTTDRTPLVAATVRDAQTDLAKANITLVVDGATIGGTAYSYDRATDRLSYISSRAVGKHTVRITAKDAQGLVYTKSWYFYVK